MPQALLASWIAFVVLIWAVSPAHFWLDSGELGAAGFELGVMHPPGASGLSACLRLGAFVPVGSLGFRLGVVSSVFGAASVGMLFAILRRRGAQAWIAWGACAWTMSSWTFVRQARVVEIYALGLLLLLVAAWGFDPHPGEPHPRARASRRADTTTRRRLVGVFAAVWGAWAFGDLRLVLVPAVVVAWGVALRRREAWARWAPTVVVFGSAVAAMLPLSSGRHPWSDWGQPRTVEAFVDHVMARSIRTAFADEIWPDSWAMWGLHAQALGRQWLEDAGPLAAAAVLFGVVVLSWGSWRDPVQRRTAMAWIWVAVASVVYALGINPMGIEDRQTGMLFVPWSALLVGDAMRRVWAHRPRWQWAVGPLAWAVLTVSAAGRSVPDAIRTRSWTPHVWTRNVLAQLPIGSLLLTQSDDLSSGVAAARMLEGARPDVVSLVAQHLDRDLPGPATSMSPWDRVGRAVAKESTERGRIEAAISAHPGPVAVEFPTTGLLAKSDFWSPYGALPLRIADPHDRVPLAPSLRDTLATWSPRMHGEEDRRRLAIAMANEARALVRAQGDTAEAERWLETLVREVRPDHASAWVTLGALADRRGQSNRAIELTRHALTLDPGRAAAMNNLALYLGRNPQTFREALQWARRAIALRPHERAGWIRLAQLRESAGDREGAQEARTAAAQRSR